MSDDIVERLRDPKYASDRIEFLECRLEAADEIERLRAEHYQAVLDAAYWQDMYEGEVSDE